MSGKMLSDSEGWILNFSVTDTETHKAGYTIYKITSIVFPRQLPQALNCLVVWHRFHDVKRLYRALKSRHKSCELPGQVPQPVNCNYFKRFNEDAIKRRKVYILNLLNFTAQYPELYKCHEFSKFLYDPVNPSEAPSIEEDPLKNGHNVNEGESYEGNAELKDVPRPNMKLSPLDLDIDAEPVSKMAEYITMNTNCEGSEYVYQAALEFSAAVQAEVNHDYIEAYASYTRGITYLRKCCDSTIHEDTKSVITAKINDYSLRADKMNNEVHSREISCISIADDLELNWHELHQFRVISVLNEKLIVVSKGDSDQKYVIKCIEKFEENDSMTSIRLPRNAPYMVNMIGYFQNKCKLFVLLPLVIGGHLIDYRHRSGADCIQSHYIRRETNVKGGEGGAAPKNEFENIVTNSKKLLESVTKTLEDSKALEDESEFTNGNEGQYSLQQSLQSISEDIIKRWACQLLVAINSLHEDGIIMKDLQTNNLLIGKRGEVLLTFFYGNKCDTDAKYKSCKTLNYGAVENHFVAPERPLSFKSDWWSYGIVIYELLVGMSFRDAHPGRIDLYGCVQYPEEVNLSPSAYDLINKLLQPNPEERLDYLDIRNHAFFEGTNWDDVLMEGLLH